MAETPLASANRASEIPGSRQLSAVVGIGIAVVVLAGFTPTYWRPIVFGPATARPFVHLHAALFFGWAVLFAVQAVLVPAGHARAHRRLGVVTAVWSGAAVVVGLRLAIVTIARDVDLIDGTLRGVLTLIPLTQVAMFAGFLGLGLLRRGDPGAHGRSMTLAALVAVTPALARIGTALLGPEALALPAVVFSASTAALVGVIGVDAHRCGRLHPVFAWGGALVVLVRIARVPFSTSGLWRATAEAIAGWVA
jgi:hypothetical protein